jgi:hypothetical protein
MLRDRNICLGLGPHYGIIIFLGAIANLIDYHIPYFCFRPTFF